MIGPVGIRRLLMAISLFAYAFAIIPGTFVSSLFFAFDCAAAFLFLFLTKLGELSEGDAADPAKGPTIIPVTDQVIYVLCVGLAFFLWPESFGLPEDAMWFILAVVIATAALTIGTIAPILPYSRYARSRPVYTMVDGGQWLLTNRLLGYGSCPLAICYIACLPSGLDFWALTALFIACWLGIPAILSYVAYRRRPPRDADGED